MEIANELGCTWRGVSLACQDYLGLTSHPAILEAAVRAIRDFGPHSAGSPVLAGNTTLSLQLEKALAEALQSDHVILFPTGWAAAYAAIAGLVRPDDHVVIDQLAHASLHQGVQASTLKIHRHAHLDTEAVRKLLRDIRAEDTRNGIMVVTEGLFSMDSDVPDLNKLQEVCTEFGATLLVDVAHDFGELGPRGGGSIAIQGLLGKVDLVMGSFSKTFASNGGFIATRSESVRQYLKAYGNPHTFSNALSPVQSAVVLTALEIVRSAAGDRLRAELMNNSVHLRGELEMRGVRCIGSPSAIVPGHIGNEAVARIAWSKAQKQGVHANLVEFPAVAVGSARFRMQLMPSHTKEQLTKTAEIISTVITEAQTLVNGMELPKRRRLNMQNGDFDYSIARKALPELTKTDLNKIIERSGTENILAGTTLINAGVNPGSLLVIIQGNVQVETDYHGQSLILAECGAGQIIGEMALIDGQGASASVVASTDVEIARISHRDLQQLCKSDPAFGMHLYQSLAVILAQRLRKANAQIAPTAHFE